NIDLQWSFSAPESEIQFFIGLSNIQTSFHILKENADLINALRGSTSAVTSRTVGCDKKQRSLSVSCFYCRRDQFCDGCSGCCDHSNGSSITLSSSQSKKSC